MEIMPIEAYNEADYKRAKQFHKELKKPCWIGENGDAACVSPTVTGAWKKFRQLTREDVGEYEAYEVRKEDIGIGYLHLTKPFATDEYGDSIEWVISGRQPSPWPVWFLEV